MQPVGELHRERGAAALRVGGFNRVGEAALDARLSHEAVHDHVQLRPSRKQSRVHVVE